MTLNSMRLILRWGRCTSHLYDGQRGKRCQLFSGHLYWHSWRSWHRREEWQWAAPIQGRAGEQTPLKAVFFHNRQKRMV